MANKSSCGGGKKIFKELNGGGSQRLKPTVVKAQPMSEADIKEPIVYDYMKYPKKKKNKMATSLAQGGMKTKKCVSFKRIVELVSFTDDWKIKTSQSNLRSEEEQVARMIQIIYINIINTFALQRKSSNLRRNF